MFAFFRKNQGFDFAQLGFDMHSHLIPGIDDGSKHLEDSLQFLQQLSEWGYRRVVTTPHIMSEYYPNTPTIIQQGLSTLQAALEERQIPIELSAAAEYFLDDAFDQLLADKEPLLTLPGRRLLVEFSTLVPPQTPLDVIFRIQAEDYRVVLAHPERYLYFGQRWEVFEQLKNRGCEFQLNLLSLTGYYGSEVKQLAIRLLKKDWIDWIGTDLHHERHLRHLGRARKDATVSKYLRGRTFRNATLGV